MGVILVRDIPLYKLCAGTATHLQKMQFDSQSISPNISSLANRAMCRKMTPCESDVDEYTSRKEVSY